jgi:hypothetical protein
LDERVPDELQAGFTRVHLRQIGSVIARSALRDEAIPIGRALSGSRLLRFARNDRLSWFELIEVAKSPANILDLFNC